MSVLFFIGSKLNRVDGKSISSIKPIKYRAKILVKSIILYKYYPMSYWFLTDQT